LNKAGQQLKILPHHVLNDKDEPVELCSSVECKGIIGNDGRHYILDLLRTFPPDVNFLQCNSSHPPLGLFVTMFVSVDEELSKEVKLLGFPIKHKHKLCCLRQELIDSFVDSRYMMFIKYAAYHLQQLNIRKGDVKLNNNQAIEENKTDKGGDQKGEAKVDENADKNDQIEDEEAKKIVESITDGSKIERMAFSFCSKLN
jgi:protein TIF31